MSETKKTKQKDFKVNVEEMAQVGVHLGHRTSSIYPKMNPYIFGSRGGIHIIDLEKTKEKLEEVLSFIEELFSEGKNLLLVGTKIQVKDLIEKTARDCGLPYVSERWLGGTFTNFSSIQKRIKHYKDLEAQKKEGELEKYTKKEQVKLNKELERLAIKFEGLRNLAAIPEAIFVCDMKKDKLAIAEAKSTGVKVIALADTNVDPNKADYFIPASDDSLSSVSYILGKIKEVILKNKR
jgi:small subunit ribosomal protein S2